MQKTLYFYILVDPDKKNAHKVGITRNPDQRLRSYRTAAPGCYFLNTYVIPDKKHEKNILYELNGAFRVEREMVHGPLSIIQNIIEGYLQDKALLETV
jgi:hypothetical protein